MDQVLTLALILLGVPCFLLLILLSIRAVCWGVGAGSTVFGAACLAAMLSDTSGYRATKIGVAAAEVAFLTVCPIWERLLQHQEEEPVFVDPEQLTAESEFRRHWMTQQDWERYRSPD